MSAAGPNAEQAGKSQVAGLEGPRQLRLAHAENDQGHKLQQQARAIENQVDGDEALEGQLERQRPGQRRRAAR